MHHGKFIPGRLHPGLPGRLHASTDRLTDRLLEPLTFQDHFHSALACEDFEGHNQISSKLILLTQIMKPSRYNVHCINMI